MKVKSQQLQQKVGDIDVAYGYPQATSAALGAAVNGLSTDWTCDTPKDDAIKCTFKGKTSYFDDSSDACYVKYTQAVQSFEAATTVVVAEGNSCK